MKGDVLSPGTRVNFQDRWIANQRQCNMCTNVFEDKQTKKIKYFHSKRHFCTSCLLTLYLSRITELERWSQFSEDHTGSSTGKTTSDTRKEIRYYRAKGTKRKHVSYLFSGSLNNINMDVHKSPRVVISLSNALRREQFYWPTFSDAYNYMSKWSFRYSKSVQH